MPGVTIRVDILEDRFGDIGGKANQKAIAIVRKAAYDIQSQAQGRAPVRTGALKNSISATASGLSAEVSVGVSYGMFVEFGTSKMAARPFLVPAAEAVKASYEAMFSGLVE